jgi:hypothetical protein
MLNFLFRPNEANAPLIVDPDRVLAPTIARKGFQPVRRRGAEVIQIAGLMQHIQLAQGWLFDAAESPDEIAHPTPANPVQTILPTAIEITQETGNL